MARRKAVSQTNGEVKQDAAAKKAEAAKIEVKQVEVDKVEEEEDETVDNGTPATETEDTSQNDKPQQSEESKNEEHLEDRAENSGDEEQQEDEENDENKDSSIPTNKSLFIKIVGFKRLPKLEDELKLYHKFFTEAMGIEAPMIQIPGHDDRWVYFELKSLEDKGKLFTELKAKGHLWEGYKLSVKSVVIRSPEDSKELRRMPLEEALNVLYPLQDVPYSQQLKDKATRAKELIDEVLPQETLSKYTKSKKYASNLRVKDVVPMFPIEGHEYVTTIYIEENPETGEVQYGLRPVVYADDKEATGIVPLELCISIPRQMQLLVKNFVENLPEMELKPYNHAKKEGDILGISIKMTLCARFVMSVIVPKIPKITAVRFKQLTLEGFTQEEGEESKQEGSYSSIIKKQTQEVKEKIEKYFNGEGKKYSLDSVYLIMAYPNNLKDDASILATHILGLSFVPDILNGVLHRLTGERSRPPIDALRPILGLIEAHAGINSSSRVYLASPFRLVGLYFAKKCAQVTMFFSWTKDNLIELQSWAKSIGVNNIEFTNAKTRHRNAFPADNSVAIFWQFTKPTLADRFLVSGITNITSVSYWNKTPPQSYVEQQKKQFETIFSKLKISHMYPVDLAPFTERIGLAVFFNGPIPYPTQQFRRKNMPAPRPLLASAGPLSSGRLGPPPGGMRGGPPYGNERPGPWQRPDPWSAGRSQPPVDLALRQLDQVASGVMQNLQAVQQQMQAFIPSLMDSAPMRPPPSDNWNKRYREDDQVDSWGSGNKRRRDDRGDWKKGGYGGKGRMNRR